VSQGRVATDAGEETKDGHYLDTVNDHGDEFIPLVCKSFSIWTLFALSTLFTLADRTTVKSGVSIQLVRKQLLQNLSLLFGGIMPK